MKNASITVLVAASLAITAPSVTSADVKDLLIGGAVGAAITHGVHTQKKNKKKSTTVVSKKSTGTPSLNSQYNRAERIQIQSALSNLGYNIGAIDGVLGKNSRRVIRQFQASRGEPQTGQLTASQFAALTNPGFQTGGASIAAVDRPLQPNEVMLLQQSLTMLGYYNGGIDGTDGPALRGASAQFVSTQGLNPQQLTQVQSTVLATRAAGIPTPVYLQQEANTQQATMAAANPFGAQTQGTQQAGFGGQQQPQQNLFGGAPAQQGTAAAANGTFGAAPAENTLFGTTQQQQQNALFGTTQQQTVPQGGAQPAATQDLFAPQQNQQPQAEPQNGTVNSLFASGETAAPAPAAQQQPASSLDVFTLQPEAPVQEQQPAVQSSGNTQIAGEQSDVGTTLFSTQPAAAAFASTE